MEEPVKQLLRMQPASLGRSMEAEARDILSRSVKGLDLSALTAAKPTGSNLISTPAQITPPGKFDHLIGIWQGRGTTDQLMQATRGED